MKNTFFTLLLLATVFSFNVLAQDKEDKSKRPSPPATAEGVINGKKIKVDYSAPSVKGRKIFGGLVPYGEVWRTGANETTTIEFDKAVKVEGKDLAAGKYALFTIPGENEWTIIFNKTVKWGAYSYKKDDDVLRVTVKPSKTATLVEAFNITVGKNDVVIKWENTSVAFKVQ